MIFNLVAISFLALGVPGETESIDSLVDRYLAENGITPARQCTDEQFLRRVTLDLAGRIPTVGELDVFLKNPDRAAKIDELIDSPEFPKFISQVWTASLVGYLNVFGTDRDALRLWLEEQIRQDTPWDRIAKELITAEGTSSLDGPVNFLVRNRDDPVVKTGRMFLGVRLDCAQCHDHPFDRWTQDDYQNMRRFFSQIRNRQQNGSYYVQDEVRSVGSAQRPVFLTGASPQTDYWRAELALFVTNSKPFARTFGNRVWYHLMGRGIVDPIDDFSSANLAAIPELVELLADHARSDQFSFREMFRRICNSRVYQRVSDSDDDPNGKRLFASQSLKPLTPEQYFDSIAVALDMDVTAVTRERFIGSMAGDALQEDFNPTWNYRETVQKTMSRLAMDIRPRNLEIPEIYRRVLTREPTAAELELCRDQSADDVLFALIHSNEFFFNH